MKVLDEELRSSAAAADSGDRDAVERALHMLWPSMVHYCRARADDGSGIDVAAEELAHEACIAVAREFSALAQAQHPRRHVYRILHGVVAKARVHPGGPGAAPLQNLDPTVREVMMLRVIDGLSAYDAAGILELPVARVLLMQHEALRTLSARVA